MATPNLTVSGNLGNHAAWYHKRPFIVDLVRQTVAAWVADSCMKYAAALACYAVLSLAPLVVILFRVLALFLRGRQSEEFITRQSQNLLGSGADSNLIQTILDSSRHSSGLVATIISIVVLIFGASGVFGELQDSMNRIWHVRLKPHAGVKAWIRTRFLSMAMVLGIGFLLLVSFFVSTLLTTFSQAFLGDGKVVGISVDVLVSLFVFTILFAMIFKFLPDVKIRWSAVWLGAFTTAVLLLAGKWGLTLYFKYGAPTSAYGVFGSLAAVVIWVYYAAQVLFLGAQFTRVHAKLRGHPLQPDSHAEVVNR